MTSFKEFRHRAAVGDGVRPAGWALPVQARPFQGERAGLASRTGAALIDLVVTVASVGLLWIALWLGQVLIRPTDLRGVPGLETAVLVGLGLLWLAWAFGWATTGRSLGAYVIGVRVVDWRGERVPWLIAAVRALLCVVFPLGLLWVVLSRDRRSLQDVVLRTSVVYDWVVRTRR